MSKPFQFRLSTLLKATAGVGVCGAAIHYGFGLLIVVFVGGIFLPMALARALSRRAETHASPRF
jgi:Zn-dependent protease with chaperone function